MTEIAVRPDESRAAALVVYKIGGREYPQKTVSKCKVCHSPYRYEIEQQVVKGRVYNRIATSLPEDASINGANVRDHYRNGHMPLDVEVGRRIVDKLAEERGRNVESDLNSLVDGITLATTVVQKAFEALASGELKPDMKDALAAATLLEKFGVREQGLAEADYAKAFLAYHDSARLAMTPEQFDAFGRILSANPVLRALSDKQTRVDNGEDPDIIDAEVEEDLDVIYEDDDEDAYGDVRDSESGYQASLTTDEAADTSISPELPHPEESL